MDLIRLDNISKSKLIKDILVHPLKINKDESGILVETLRTDWEGVYGRGRRFAMQYYSVTKKGVARDEDVWHYHPRQEDRFLLAQGAIVAAVADNREGSSTFSLLNLFYMEQDKNPYILLIPKKTLHGFLVVSEEPAILLNFPTKLYNPKEEIRVPHNIDKIKFSNGEIFSWEKIRREFFKI